MKTAVMQPYFFPYIGYYQLLGAVDTFVILDDVNFIKRGWINRNNILLNGIPHLFSIPLRKPSQNKLISETKLNFSSKEKEKFFKKIQAAYKKAAQFSAFYGVLEKMVFYEEEDLTSYIYHSIVCICEYLDINTKIVRSSEIEKDNSLKAQDRIIEICKKIGTDLYVNPSGGKSLYSIETFKNENIDLKFIHTKFDSVVYKQFDIDFVANLSFLDALMFNDKKTLKKMLCQYTLV
ncbi:WbqC family protein [uncultured Pseudodesulfovibrio sp.]|uniref:WbqC family protein n=1 Tax=uncultured Pseudodesulfovibrio sp. TaxID=2035858 RepID=UPI0029C60650|nr:WbqC family protein [uncultured Pseudodesulfovibrio sp.]